MYAALPDDGRTVPQSLRQLLDVAGGLTTLVFVGWVLLDLFPPTWSQPLDYGVFTATALVAAGWQLLAATRARSAREAWGWRLFAAGSLVRMLVGHVWTVWVIANGGADRPLWLFVLSCVGPLLVMSALITFSVEPRGAADRRRLALDIAIVVVGSGVVLWAAGLGPFFATEGTRAAGIDDYVIAAADALSATLAAVLYLRSSTTYLRTVALLLLSAYLLQVVPDVLLFLRGAAFTYEPGDAFAVVWFAVWVLKAAAARYAVRVLEARDDRAFERLPGYRGGAMPYVFLAVANVVVFVELVRPGPSSTVPYVVAAFTLATLLVTREQVEIRERERLQAALRDEEASFGALLRDAYDFALLLDDAGRVLLATPATQRLLGQALLSGEPWGFLEAGLQEDRESLRRAIERPANAPPVLLFRVTQEQGEAAVLLRIDDRRDDPMVGAIVLSGYDQSREVQLRARLQQTEEAEAIGIFAGGLAHDFNNILAAINGHAEILREDLATGSTEREDLEGVFSSIHRARRLTSGFLALSRRKQQRRRRVAVVDLLRARAAALTTATAPVTRVRWDDQSGGEVLDTEPDALGIGVDALLRAAVAGDGVITIRRELVSRSDAEDVGIEPGAYLVLRASRTLGGKSRAQTTTDELEELMAIAALRELRGAFAVESPTDGARMFIPVAS
ncbi:MAG: histidine kinase dimerization/phospho-acceptor domain-containing protein [Gemmatimonadaceae bacterium]|nr:histidine kinase dimerization/phospho-acceptor domain-containing protein [Gemmatimonadaceae bacterium]